MGNTILELHAPEDYTAHLIAQPFDFFGNGCVPEPFGKVEEILLVVLFHGTIMHHIGAAQQKALVQVRTPGPSSETPSWVTLAYSMT
jgi:hypothetical protein